MEHPPHSRPTGRGGGESRKLEAEILRLNSAIEEIGNELYRDSNGRGQNRAVRIINNIDTWRVKG